MHSKIAKVECDATARDTVLIPCRRLDLEQTIFNVKTPFKKVINEGKEKREKYK